MYPMYVMSVMYVHEMYVMYVMHVMYVPNHTNTHKEVHSHTNAQKKVHSSNKDSVRQSHTIPILNGYKEGVFCSERKGVVW